MAIERTLSILKPDAIAKNVIGSIVAKLEGEDLKIIAQRMMRLTVVQAREFYAVHKERPFYDSLIAFMTEAPVLVQVLEGEDAVAKNRAIMGDTDPAKAADGTIRAAFGSNIERNACHGSDSVENAAIECVFFFSNSELASLAR